MVVAKKKPATKKKAVKKTTAKKATKKTTTKKATAKKKTAKKVSSSKLKRTSGGIGDLYVSNNSTVSVNKHSIYKKGGKLKDTCP